MQLIVQLVHNVFDVLHMYGVAMRLRLLSYLLLEAAVASSMLFLRYRHQVIAEKLRTS